MPQLAPTTSSTFPQTLLVLELAGTKYLFAERGPMSIAMDGSDAMFHPGLVSSEIEMSIDLFGTSASSRSVSVQVDLGNVVDTQTLFGIGVALYMARASLYLYIGGAFETAQRVASGVVRDPVYADPSDPRLFGFTIDRDFTERALYPSSTAYLRDDSFSLAGAVDDNDLGLFYPTPIGKPGATSRSLAGVIKTFQAPRANVGAVDPANDRIVVALGAVLATSCRVWSNVNHSDTVSLLTATDAYGNLVTYMDLTTAGTPADFGDEDTGPTYVAFNQEGIPGPSGEGMRGLGDVVVWAMGLSSLAKTGDIDWKRVLGNQDKLNALGRVDTWIAARIKPLDWLISDVLAYFPVFVADMGDGLYVDVWDYSPDALTELYIDTRIGGFERCSPVAWSSQAVASKITVRGHICSNGSYYTTVVGSGNPDDVAEPDVDLVSGTGVTRSSELLRRGYELFGENEIEVPVPTVQEPATLDRILDFHISKHALPTSSVGYIIPWRKTSVRPGMRVLVNDPEAGYTDAKGVVSGFRYTRGTLQVKVSMLPV